MQGAYAPAAHIACNVSDDFDGGDSGANGGAAAGGEGHLRGRDDPGFDYAAFDFGDRARWLEQTRRAAKLLNATDTDLSGFRTAGGKLILWNGWSDPAIPATGTIRYYEGVDAGDEGVDEYLRMFMLPGVLHCAGGSGPDFVDWIAAIQAWVEEDRAPDRLVAVKMNQDEVVMQRPVCAWPARAVYDGSGDPRREESFECVTP